MPTGVGAGKAKIFNYRVRGYPGLHLIFLKFGHRNEYGKVRYIYIYNRATCMLLHAHASTLHQLDIFMHASLGCLGIGVVASTATRARPMS
jgi:hypothetical protein